LRRGVRLGVIPLGGEPPGEQLGLVQAMPKFTILAVRN